MPAIGSTFVAAFMGAVLGTYPIDRELTPAFSLGRWAGNVTAVLALRIGIWTVLLGYLLLAVSLAKGLRQ
jgi:hypothetical protein